MVLSWVEESLLLRGEWTVSNLIIRKLLFCFPRIRVALLGGTLPETVPTMVAKEVI